MPIGYLITTACMATAAVTAASRHRPRSSRPFRLSYVFGLWLNWPFVAFLALVASTALAIAQSGVGSLVFLIGFAFAALALAALVPLRRRALGTGPALEHGLDHGLGSDWPNKVDSELAARIRRRPLLTRIMLAPVAFRRQGVERIKNVRYGPTGRNNLLDVYRDRSDRSGRPTLIYLHGGGFYFGSKRLGARHLLYRLASAGWVCVSANYSPDFPDQLIDMKRMISWAREHAGEYGADPAAVFLAGSSAGAHLASLAALTPDDPRFQPDFESADTSVAGAITLYGYYGPVASGDPPSSPLAYVTTKAPPYFVVHGDQDSLVVVDDARRFVEQLRAASSNPVVYAELPGAQHGFDLFRSRRFETVVDAIEVFSAGVRSAPESFGTNSERHPRLP